VKGGPRRAPRAHGTAPVPSAPAPENPAALIAVALVASACIVVSVSNRLFDFDIWQHLLVGKAIWLEHRVPRVHLWTWPSYGKPDVLPSWLYRAALWPFWSRGGMTGLFVWRWVTTLIVFAAMAAAARRLGARGLSMFGVLVLCSLVYKQRSQCRPETLAAVLLALSIWILETRRRGGPDRALLLIPIAWIWANSHISYYLGFVLIALYGLDHAWAARASATSDPSWAAGSRRLIAVALAAAAISFVNPFGWRALAQPFQYFFVWRHEPIFQTITELLPVDWSRNWRNGLPLLMAGWPLLLLWRARRYGLDRVELVLAALFTALALTGRRFLGFYAVAAGPFVARDLSDWLATRSAGAPSPLRAPIARAALASAACVAVGLLEWTAPGQAPSIGFDWSRHPVRACDFIEREGVRGRGFNPFHFGGYMLFRFWPDTTRLPFIDIHQSGTREDRNQYYWSMSVPEFWTRLDGRFHFDYCLLQRPQLETDHLLDVLDADTTGWALVFVDDAAALYVRRGGALDPIARRFAYRLVPAGPARLEALRALCKADSSACERVTREFERAIASSEWNADARSLLANADLMRGRNADARRELLAALAVNPTTPRAHERLGLIALAENRPDQALREFLLEPRREKSEVGRDLHVAEAYRRMGNLSSARSWYRKALSRDPANRIAADSLESIDRGGAR
jgi:hypothetical protein